MKKGWYTEQRTACGANERKAIFRDDADRHALWGRTSRKLACGPARAGGSFGVSSRAVLQGHGGAHPGDAPTGRPSGAQVLPGVHRECTGRKAESLRSR